MLSSMRRLGRLVPVLVMLFIPLAMGFGQTPEVEPNDTCPDAQILGTPSLPLVIEGELSRPPEEPDIDFFTLIGPPDTLLQIDHRGVSSEGGTLDDPFLGVLDGACGLLALDDDGGNGLDSRVFVTVPPDGVLVLAASSYYDGGLSGAGYSRGSYTITVDVARVVASIRARLVDAETFMPLVGDWPLYARAELWRCHDSVCDEHASTLMSDPDGQVVFTSDFGGWPLAPGVYEVRAYSQAHESAGSGVFEALEFEHVDLGDIALTPYDLIGSISGRIVDTIDGSGLSGAGPPWAAVDLFRCSEWECWDYVGSSYADHDGSFRFDYSNTGTPLFTGDYRLRAWADQYRIRDEIPVAAVTEDEDRDVGLVRLRPFPVQFFDVTPCQDIPAAGGACEYSVVVRAGIRSRLDAEAWSIVNLWGIGSFVNGSQFQAGGTKSTVPVTERFKLAPGETRRLQFRFDVPGSVQPGAWICASAYVGQRPEAQYTTLGFRDLFCVTKQWEAFELVPEKEMRKRLHGNR